ncbi:hypothetical protein C0J52_08017 [Blattella germanica]|nr:hypothetical protein C0J52_08017 [Blattella germanica]
MFLRFQKEKSEEVGFDRGNTCRYRSKNADYSQEIFTPISAGMRNLKNIRIKGT